MVPVLFSCVLSAQTMVETPVEKLFEALIDRGAVLLATVASWAASRRCTAGHRYSRL